MSRVQVVTPMRLRSPIWVRGCANVPMWCFTAFYAGLVSQLARICHLGGIGRTRHVHPWVWTTWAAMRILWANTHTGCQVLHLVHCLHEAGAVSDEIGVWTVCTCAARASCTLFRHMAPGSTPGPNLTKMGTWPCPHHVPTSPFRRTGAQWCRWCSELAIMCSSKSMETE